jgi:adenylate cyclase
MIEIERKFLITSEEFKSAAYSSKRIKQGYLSTVPERTVRIRIKEDKAYLTIKGLSSKNGLSRYEWEKEIPVNDAEQLLELCQEGIIDKTRYEIKVGKHTYEVDEFYGANAGLVLAEIELSSENENYEKPAWLGDEVTTDHRYYNAYLSSNPFTYW